MVPNYFMCLECGWHILDAGWVIIVNLFSAGTYRSKQRGNDWLIQKYSTDSGEGDGQWQGVWFEAFYLTVSDLNKAPSDWKGFLNWGRPASAEFGTDHTSTITAKNWMDMGHSLPFQPGFDRGMLAGLCREACTAAVPFLRVNRGLPSLLMLAGQM